MVHHLGGGNFKLSNGKSVNLLTRDGAHTFLQVESNTAPFKHFSKIVQEITKLRSKRRLNGKDKADMKIMYNLVESVSGNSSRDIFRQNVPQEEIKVLLDHLTEEMKKFSSDEDWIATGNLPHHDIMVISTYNGLMQHAVPVVYAFECEFFNVMSEFVKARKGNGRALPCPLIAELVTLVVSSAYNTSRDAFDNKWTTERALKKLDETGVLEEVIRCATVPPSGIDSPGLLRMFDEFQACAPFLQKKVQKGQRCGDTVDAILECKDGSTVERPIILNKLRTMARFSDSHRQNFRAGAKMCRYCGRSSSSEEFQKSLMKCGRCQSAFYCNKECQRADWKDHKKACFPSTKSDQKSAQAIMNTVADFCQNQYVHIMVKMAKACEESGLTKDEMLVELDFRPNGEGIVPAMKEPPEFKVAPVHDYVEGSRPAIADWYCKIPDKERYKNGLVRVIKEQYKKMLPIHLLCLVRFTGGSPICTKIQLPDPATTVQTYTQEVVLAFQKYMKDLDEKHFSNTFRPKYLKLLKLQLAYFYGYGTIDEE